MSAIKCHKCKDDLTYRENYDHRCYEICNECSAIPVHGLSAWMFHDYESLVDTIIQCEYTEATGISTRLKDAHTKLYEAHCEFADALKEQGFLVG